MYFAGQEHGEREAHEACKPCSYYVFRDIYIPPSLLTCSNEAMIKLEYPLHNPFDATYQNSDLSSS